MFESGKNRDRARRPAVESLDGRCLLSGIVGNHIGFAASTADVQGAHPGNNAMAPDGHAKVLQSSLTFTKITWS